MKEYPEIQSIFKRDEKTHKVIEGDFSLPELEYLANNQWVWTEKIDGTNIRIMWDGVDAFSIGGKTDNAQIPPFLAKKIMEVFTVDKFKEANMPQMCLYLEGYGARIQKGGGNYIPNGVDVILFDILIDTWWLKRDGIDDIASKLGLKVVPIIGQGTIYDAVSAIKTGVKSTFGDFEAEGMVLKPIVELFSRNGNRIITKVKHKDF